MEISENDLSNNEPLRDFIIAGIIGSSFSDSIMHPLDTIKTRQQAAPEIIKYQKTLPGFLTILKEEGIRKGLFAGYGAAMLGSIPRGITFFGTYEYLKKTLIQDYKINETVTHLFSGMMGDLVTSIIFVPSEVLKSRLQLQGKYNNEFFKSGYNYNGLIDAIYQINKENNKGIKNFYTGYKATLYRDLPFSAIQFSIYEKLRKIAINIENKKNLSIISELMIGGFAGGITGIITTPLDVIKTRIQTEDKLLKNSSIFNGIKIIYKKQGLKTLFSGVQPRFIWTFTQSSLMLLVYQEILKKVQNLEHNKLQS